MLRLRDGSWIRPGMIAQIEVQALENEDEHDDDNQTYFPSLYIRTINGQSFRCNFPARFATEAEAKETGQRDADLLGAACREATHEAMAMAGGPTTDW